MERLLDFSKEFDVNLLQQVLMALNTGNPQERAQANNVLTSLKENIEAWRVVGNILDNTQDASTKFFALQILEDTIKYRWLALPKDQREGIRNYTVKKIIDYSKDESTLSSEKLFVRKLNLILVHILKQEWPHNWPNFIPEIVNSSRSGEVICENNMHILKLLSEEVFDFSKEEMTTDKVRTMKQQLNSEFKQIFELCQQVLNQSQRPSLISITLQTLLRFLSWIPLGYIFETPLVNQLLTKFLPTRPFRNDTLACLTEIGSLSQANYNHVFQNIFTTLIRNLMQTLPPETNIAAAYETAQEYDCLYIQGLSLFFSGFFSAHLELLEKVENHKDTLSAMMYLVNISMVDDKEIFKICLEYWNKFASDLYRTECAPRGMGGSNVLNLGMSFANSNSPRKTLYSNVLSKVRNVMISRMAKPEEVLVVEGDDGTIVRETTKDTDAIAQYKTMRETLVYLTHLDYEDTENIMLTKLALQCDDKSNEFSWNNLNTLCWAIGSISGAMNEDDEKRFLVTVIKDLLSLCEMKRGKDNKAVVASNIMYVVGQYPRFLRAHWKFLKTVVTKLFEFMHELHPGVQDMACDTFLKISQKCKGQFVLQQQGEANPFIVDLLRNLPSIVSDLQPHQIQTFYEACGHMIREQTNQQQREELLMQLMEPPNASWRNIMNSANGDVSTLQKQDTIKEIGKILRTNVRVCSAIGHPFVSQLGKFYLDMLNVYKTYSEYISHAVQSEGEVVTQHANIRAMRGVKVEALKLIEVFVSKSEDPKMVAEKIVAMLYDTVLSDYQRSVPAARNPEVLKLFAAIVNRLRGEMSAGLPRIFDAVFDSTLSMITTNFTDFPEHRLYFFKLLKSVNMYCFQALFSIPAAAQKKVIDSIVWAFKHTERNISETGLDILEKLLSNVQQNQGFAQGFYSTYFLSLLQDVLYVLTDRLHKSGFKMHCTILKHMFTIVETNQIQAPLYPNNYQAQPGNANSAFLREYVANMIGNAFPNVGKSVVAEFVNGLFDTSKDLVAFKTHLRDFLIRLKEFSADGDDNKKLYTEETEAEIKNKLMQRAQVPGLLTQAEQDEMADL